MGIFEGQIDDGAITEGKLDPAAQAKLNAGTNPTDASQAEAEAGTETANRSWSPERVGQAIAALQTPEAFTSGAHDGDDHSGVPAIAPPSQPEAEAGTATTPRLWTAERVGQAIAALAPGANNFGIGAVGEISGGANTVIGAGAYSATGLFADPIDNQDQTRVLGGGGSVSVDPGFSPANSRGGLILGKSLRGDNLGRLSALITPNSNAQVRAFWGFAQSGSSLANILVDSPLVKHFGFQFSSFRGDTTWQISRRQTSQLLTNTGYNYQLGNQSLFVIDFLSNGNSAEYQARVRVFDRNTLFAAQWAGNAWPTPDFDQTFVYTDQLPVGDMQCFFAIEMLTTSKPIIAAEGFRFQNWANFTPFPAP